MNETEDGGEWMEWKGRLSRQQDLEYSVMPNRDDSECGGSEDRTLAELEMQVEDCGSRVTLCDRSSIAPVTSWASDAVSASVSVAIGAELIAVTFIFSLSRGGFCLPSALDRAAEGDTQGSEVFESLSAFLTHTVDGFQEQFFTDVAARLGPAAES